MTLPPQGAPVASRRRAWTGILCVLLLVSGVFAAWQAHELWFSPPPGAARPDGRTAQTPPRSPRPVARTRPAPRLPAPATESQPDTSLPDPFAELDVGPVDQDPVGLPPPLGATGRRAHAMPDSSVVAQYDWRGTVPQAADHYEKTLREAGYSLLDTSADERGWEYRKFDLEGKRVVVALHRDAQDGNIVSIEVTVIRPPK